MFKHGRKEQQISIEDRFLNLPQYVLETLQKSWAEDFYNNIFLEINEDRFSVLYSNTYSRPNKPVNILISLLILKELQGLTDEQLLGSLYFDYRYQYALGIGDFEKEKICINTLTNFRKRLVEHEVTTKEDLLKEEVNALSHRLAEIIELDKSMARMDSFMLSSSCKKLTRLELVYKVVQQMVNALHQLNPSYLPDSFQGYLKEEHKNQTLYHVRNNEVGTKLDAQFDHAVTLYRHVVTIAECKEMKEFKLLHRLINEQCFETEEGVVIPIEAKKVSPDSLQNPSDPDATYRNKSGKGNVGYVVNLVEVRDQEKQTGLILSHDVQNNLYSDAKFGEEFINHDPLSNEIKTLATDGAYNRQSTLQQAKEKEVELNLSNMTGRKPSKEQISVHEFKRDENKLVTECPAGQKPIMSKFDSKKEVYIAKFSKTVCAVCPLKDECPVQKQKKHNTMRFTEKKLQSNMLRSEMHSERHQTLSKFRAGVEGIVSALRRGFDMDDIPIRGLVRSKIWIHTKILAYNFKSVVKYKAKMV
jgi:hypothetical protein